MSAELQETTPSEGLQRQCRPDEQLKWVVGKDLKTMVLGTVASSMTLNLGLGAFGIAAAGIAIATSGMVLLGLLLFLLITFGPPLAKIGYVAALAKYGNFEYAATTDRFLDYRETFTSTDVDSVPVDRVRDAEYREDVWDKIFGTGDIYLDGARGDSLSFTNAPEGDAVLRAVREDIVDADTVDVENPAAAMKEVTGAGE